MTNSLVGIAEALEALAAAGAERSPESLTAAELVAVNKAYGALRRRVDAAFAPVAAEIARQSRRELGKQSFAKRQGFASPAALISTTSGTGIGEALRIVQVGEATAPRMTLTGDPLPAKRQYVAASVARGDLGVTPAAAIVHSSTGWPSAQTPRASTRPNGSSSSSRRGCGQTNSPSSSRASRPTSIPMVWNRGTRMPGRSALSSSRSATAW